MLPLYENKENSFEIFMKKSKHAAPHLHHSIEFVYVTQGSMVLGIGQNMYPMETGDFAVVFPDLIHHYQVFDAGRCMSLYMLAAPSLSGPYQSLLQQSCPKDPVIPGASLHPDICYALESLLENFSAVSFHHGLQYGQKKSQKGENTEQYEILWQSFIQIILTRSLPFYNLVDKSSIGSNDLIYQAVSYIAAHFQEPVTLTGMAHDLGVSPYALSRVFSGTFHRNFNQYLNQARLEYACNLLRHSDQSVTEILGNAGFDSQRTFNRVFREEYRMTPREYRKQYQ